MVDASPDWRCVNETPPPDDPVWRRFGPEHNKPCNDPFVLTCAKWECQKADRCAIAGHRVMAVGQELDAPSAQNAVQLTDD